MVVRGVEEVSRIRHVLHLGSLHGMVGSETGCEGMEGRAEGEELKRFSVLMKLVG